MGKNLSKNIFVFLCDKDRSLFHKLNKLANIKVFYYNCLKNLPDSFYRVDMYIINIFIKGKSTLKFANELTKIGNNVLLVSDVVKKDFCGECLNEYLKFENRKEFNLIKKYINKLI